MANEKLLERLRKRRKNIKSGGGNFKYFSIKADTTSRMRCLPFDENDANADFAIEVVTFWLGKDIGLIVSPATFGENCAIMEAYRELSESNDEDDKQLSERFKPGKKFASPHIRYKDDKGKEVDEEAGVKIYLMPVGVYTDLLDLFLEPEQGDFTDAMEGYDIKYKRTGKGKNDTEYGTIPCKPSRLPKKYRKVYDAEELLRETMLSYDETKEAIEKYLKIDMDDDDDDSSSKKKKKSKPSSKDKLAKRKAARAKRKKKDL